MDAKNEFPKFKEEKNEIIKKLKQLNNKEASAILTWARNTFEGKTIYISPKNDIINVRKIIKVESNNNGYFYLKLTGDVLSYMSNNNGFEIPSGRRRVLSYTQKYKQYYSLVVKPDCSLFYGDYKFMTNDEWEAEFKKAKNINNWLLDKYYEPIYMCDLVVYIKDNKLLKHSVCGFDENTGLFKILHEIKFDNGTKSYNYEYRMGSEIVKV